MVPCESSSAPRQLDAERSATVITALALRLAAPSTAGLSYLVVAAYSLLGRAQVIQSLALSWFLSMINPGLAPEAQWASVGRYVVLAAAAASVMARSLFFVSGQGVPVHRAVLSTTLLGLIIVLHSLLFSPLPDVSVLKAASWTLVVATLLSAWSSLSDVEQQGVESRLFGGLVVIMISSLPFLVSSVGYLRNGTGFQGVLSHPQAFGPTMALLGAWAASSVLAARRPAWSLVGIFAACVVLVVLSEARTAGLALVLGVGVAALRKV